MPLGFTLVRYFSWEKHFNVHRLSQPGKRSTWSYLGSMKVILLVLIPLLNSETLRNIKFLFQKGEAATPPAKRLQGLHQVSHTQHLNCFKVSARNCLELEHSSAAQQCRNAAALKEKIRKPPPKKQRGSLSVSEVKEVQNKAQRAKNKLKR